jgi:hypothetical protein
MRDSVAGNWTGDRTMAHTTDGYYTIRIPKLDGYKTLIVNAVLVLLGVVALFRPHWVLPNADTLGLAYDQLTGLIVMVVGGINTLLRLMTSSPVAAPVNVLRTRVTIPADSPELEAALRNAYRVGKERGIATEREAQRVSPQDLADAYANDARLVRRARPEVVCNHNWTPAGVCGWCGAQRPWEGQEAHEEVHALASRPGPSSAAVVAFLAFLAPSVLLGIGEASMAVAKVLA